MDSFHFMRPFWLLLLLLLPVIPFLLRHRGQGQSGWSKIIPEALLRPLLSEAQGGASARTRPVLVLALLIAAIATALAGPSWRQADTPLQQQNDSLVIVLDLSLSMLATDVEPDRLTRAKRKIRDILASRDGSLTGLVVYSADAHVVTPLTDDRKTIESLLGVIDPFMMPAAGNRVDLAIERATSLLDQGAPGDGRILLISDGVKFEFAEVVRDKLSNSLYPLNTLAVGTEEGGPIPLPKEGFIRDGNEIVISKTRPEQLARLSSATNGKHTTLTLDNSDIRTLELRSADSDDWQDSERDLAIQRWQDDGYWLLWLAVPLALLAWRRGALIILPLALMPLFPQNAQAMDWADLWSRPDQRGEQLIEQDAAKAADKFSDPDWRGSALYRAGSYQAAAEQFAGQDNAEAHYNRGNALARAEELQKAITAYDRALAKNPEHEDAQHNRELVKQLLEQQQQQKKNKQQQQREQQKKNQQQNQNRNQQNQNSQNQEDGDQGQSGNDSGGQQSQEQQGQNSQDGQQQGQSSSSGQQGEEGQSGGSQSGDPGQQQGNGGSSQEQGDADQPPQNTGGQQQGQAGEGSPEDSREPGALAPAQTSPLSQSEEQWLRRIPDDPSGLMRRKFLYQYRERNTQQPKEGDTPW